MNPVKAKMVEHPEDYPWSSYRTLLGINDDKMTEAGRTWAYFGKNARILILMRQTQKKVSG